MELIKRNIHMDRIRTEALSQITPEDDINIPDNKPDVDMINMEKGEILIDEVKAGADTVNIRGSLVFWVLYCTAERGGGLDVLEGKIPFEERVNLQGCTPQDAVMVDGGLVYEAGLKPYNLKPVVAEFYGSKDGASLMETQVSVLTQLLWGEARTLSVLHLQGTSCWGSLYCGRLSPALTCGGWKLGSFWETVDFKSPDGNAAGCC